MTMVERAVLFGRNGTLMGVLSAPESRGTVDLAVLMFNAGVLPRVGPHRLNVKMARALAARNVPSFRFDLSGHGDSRPCAELNDYAHQSIADVSAAMDFVQQELGVSKFLIIGLCSGAIHGFEVAVRDDRVVGLLLHDGHWYRTPLTIPVRHWKRFRAIGIASSIRAVAARAKRRLSRGRSRALDQEGLWTGQPTKQQFADAMSKIDRRGVLVLIVYSELMQRLGLYSYKSQFAHAFAGREFVGRVKVALRPDLDHTLSTLKAQQAFTELAIELVSDVMKVRPRIA